MHPRLARELKTVQAMLAIFCAAQHNGRELCSECRDLLAYAQARLELCPFGPDKPPCRDCRVHCYTPPRRARIQEVMRFAGPRLLKKHPYLALRHVLDGLRKTPKRRAS
ncbi:MAG: nitrous oxide-stimulated promoter family protein [Elusimicrobia bacterium]|nr:nitrous oxide-stimulated promoter family protein [Elusimicrobiota bacterium]